MKFKVKYRLVDEKLNVLQSTTGEENLESDASIQSIYKKIKGLGISKMKLHLDHLNQDMSVWDGINRTPADFGVIKVFACMQTLNGDEDIIPLQDMLSTWELFNGTREVHFRYKPYIFTFIKTHRGYPEIMLFQFW